MGICKSNMLICCPRNNSANNDVYLGWTSWSAGGFGSSYELNETPNGNTDTYIVSQCFAAKWKN